MRTFNPNAKHPARAVQAWQILVGKAMNRQTVTYEGLSVLMYGKRAPGVLGNILGHILFYCADNKLPALTAIVVGKGRGTPGQGAFVNPADIEEVLVDSANIDEERERVYKETDWYNVYPPSEDDLIAAYFRHMRA